MSKRLTPILEAAGHDVRHVQDLGLEFAEDVAIFEKAFAERRVVVTYDTDFGKIAVQGNNPGVSVILLRNIQLATSQALGQFLCERIGQFGWAIEGQPRILVLHEHRTRLRHLPSDFSPESI
jgi:predicted nuclease of predicted toxin-antitoxin system